MWSCALPSVASPLTRSLRCATRVAGDLHFQFRLSKPASYRERSSSAAAAAGSPAMSSSAGGSGSGSGSGNGGGTDQPGPVQAALVDLNGTLHVEDAATPGAQQALQRLREAGVDCRFVTNTTKDTIGNLLALVQGLGFDIRREEVFSSLTATRRLLEQRGLRPFLLLHPKALPDFEGIPTDSPNAVVVGLAKEAFTYENMNIAFRILLSDPDAPLIAIHKGRVFKEPDGLSLGPGPFVLALEHASGREAQVVGKPQASFFQLALDSLGCPPQDAVMIGDDVRDDVGGAQAAGLRGILVQTGKYRPGDEAGAGVQPAATVPDFAAAVQWILEKNAAAAEAGAGGVDGAVRQLTN